MEVSTIQNYTAKWPDGITDEFVVGSLNLGAEHV